MTREEKIEEFVRAQRLQSFRLIEKTDEISASKDAKDFWLIVQTTYRPKKRCKEVAEKAMLAKRLKKTGAQDRLL